MPDKVVKIEIAVPDMVKMKLGLVATPHPAGQRDTKESRGVRAGSTPGELVLHRHFDVGDRQLPARVWILHHHRSLQRNCTLPVPVHQQH